MDEYERELALYKVQEEIVKKIKSLKKADYQKAKNILNYLFEDRNNIMQSDDETIKKYLKIEV
jgi:hypothetical protein